jgi:hypothetical protein
MTWQEYQEAVGTLYEEMGTFGVVKKNITIPDRVTGQPRQVDVWWEMEVGDHIFKVLIDAKKRNGKIDVKDVEEIVALARAVNADKAIIVTNGDWTSPAEVYANFEGLDLRLFTIDEATDLIVEDKWKMCTVCNEDCVLMNNTGFFEIAGAINWWLGGNCRGCKTMYIHCQDCGQKGVIPLENSWQCLCPLLWSNKSGQLEVYQISDVDETVEPENPLQLKIDFGEE